MKFFKWFFSDKQSLLFSMTMCICMVIGMTAYNVLLNYWYQDWFWTTLLFSIFSGYFIAQILSLFIVGPLAKKVAFMLPIDKSKEIQIVLSISGCMILGMSFCMALYSVVIHSGFSSNFFSLFISGWLSSLIFAIPLQLLLVGPWVRALFPTFWKK